MHCDRLQRRLRSVATGLVTPFDKELAVDHTALAENVQALSEQGMETFLACANVSEYHSLSHCERIAVTETSVNAAPDGATVLAGAGGSTKTVIDLGSAYERVGVDGVMVMPPHHTYVHERGLLEYYDRIGDAVDLPLVPYLRGFDPTVKFVSALTRFDAVVGVKWTIEDVPMFAEVVQTGADDVVWMNGLGEAYAVALHTEGAESLSSGIAAFEPAIGRSLFAALDAGETERAREIRDAAVPFMNFRAEAGAENTLPGANSVPALKAGLEFAGLNGGPVREPLVELDDEECERAQALYDDLAAFVRDEL